MPLEDYYIGDDAFNKFAQTPDAKLDADFLKWKKRDELINLCKDDLLLSRTIFRIHWKNAITFMSTKIPALDGITPLECLETSTGVDRLKECLLRTH